MRSPQVSVLMPVYNGEKYLKEAIDSVLAQSFTDYELIITNDGSNDGSKKIIQSYADSRIRYIENSIPSGLKMVRNQGLEAAKGRYVAIIDCDDVWYPKRLEKQIKFLDENPHFSMLGSRAAFLDENGQIKGVAWRYDLKPSSIPPFFLFGNYFIHSSILLRRSMIPKEGYQATTAEDYDLWIRMSQNGQVWSLPDILVKYRVHSGGDTYRQAVLANRTQEQVQQIHLGLIQQLGIDPSEEEKEVHRAIQTKKFESLEQLKLGGKWLKKIWESNVEKKKYDQMSLTETILERWLICCVSASRSGFFGAVRIYFSFSISSKQLFFSAIRHIVPFIRYKMNADLGKIG